ncbi:hypothetical protein [Iamia sp.]|uniref:hypothetical protein n=1 Tax=Iamia sp. TaxID=2722710 RepID=UPI002C2AAB44|nr:hypothetical protein [Iamia sp.]HXH59275.1 hypothetical protein [Iamia sp.]
MKQSIDAAWDDHPSGPDDQEDTPPVWWILNLVDDIEGIDDIRVQVVLEVPGASERIAAHLAPATARRLRAALTTALRTVGEDDA